MQRMALVCCVALVLGLQARLAGQDSLAAARQLYAAAEYHNALAMLGSLLAANPSPQERQAIELYRIFCLFAVNDVESANSALEAMIVRDPLYRPGAEVVPRRLQPAFAEARKRLLPAIVQEKYAAAKEAFDRSDYKAASEGFTQTLRILSDPELGADANQRSFADLRVLASGFNELSVRALAPPAPAPVDAPAPPPAAAPAAPRIYHGDDERVRPPVAIRQDMPRFPTTALSQRNGILELVISEAGTVESASIIATLNPRYNALVLAAAKFWRYRPATVDGVPVKFRKRIQLTVTPDR